MAALYGGALQRAAGDVVAHQLGHVGGVEHRQIVVKNSQQPVSGQPLQPQQQAAGGGVVHRLVVAAQVHQVDAAGQLPVPRRQRAHGKPPVVAGKPHRDGGALDAGHLPAEQLPERRVVDRQLGGVAAGFRHHRQRAVGGHGAQQQRVLGGAGVQRAGAAFHPQLGAGPVVHHKMTAPRGQRGPGVAGLEGPDLAAGGGEHHHIPVVQLHKAAAQRLDLQRRGDAGVGGPGAVVVQIDGQGICHIAQQHQRIRKGAGEHPHHRGGCQQQHAPERVAAALILFQMGAGVDGLHPCALRLRGRLGSVPPQMPGGAQSHVAAGAGHRARLFAPLPRQHPLPPGKTLLVAAIHGNPPSWKLGMRN